MEKVLSMARGIADSAEVYYRKIRETEIVFEDSSPSSINHSRRTGVALRIRKGERVGSSYCSELHDPADLVRRAVASLDAGAKALFTFPQGHSAEELETFDPQIEQLSDPQVINEIMRICVLLAGELKGKGQCNVSASYGEVLLHIINTAGLDVSQKTSFYRVLPQILFPNSQESLRVRESSTGFRMFPEARLIDLARAFLSGLPVLDVSSKGLDTIIAPNAFHAFLWRLEAAASAASLCEGVSRLKGKVGQQIASNEFSLEDDARIKGVSQSRWFDDEGVPTRSRHIIENGIFRGFFSDLDSASRLKLEPTGHGYRTALWGGDPVSLKPSPSLSHCRVKPGSESLEDMIASTTRGILIEGILGAHSGNIPNGDFSVGLSPGLYIENGKIKGRLRNTMFSGNIYTLLKNITSIECLLHESERGMFPHIKMGDVL